MERPNVSDEKYKLSNDFECIKFHPSGYLADINKHIDQLEVERKELETTMCEILTAILKIPMCQEVGYLQESIKSAARNKNNG